MESGKSKMSNVEWGLVIGALAVIDLVQFCLDIIVVGFVINPFIDLLTGMSLAFYLHQRGERMTDWKRLGALLATMLFDGLFDGTIPLWVLDGIFNMLLSKFAKRAEVIAGKIPGANIAKNVAIGSVDKHNKNVDDTRNAA